MQTFKEENRASSNYTDCLYEKDCLEACWEQVTTPNPDPTKGAFLACYALDMPWSAFPTDLKEANLSKLQTVLNKVVGDQVLQVRIIKQHLASMYVTSY